MRDHPKPPRRLHFLITAGPTREYIDPVRYLSNDSSGLTGFLLAEAALKRGHLVTLVHGPVSLTPPAGATVFGVTSAREMLAVCQKAWPRCDLLVATAAVADFRVAKPSKVKLKKSASGLTLALTLNPDILAVLSAVRRPDQTVIGFALEDRDGRRNAERKLLAKGLDAIVLNAPSAINAASNRVEVLTRDGKWTAWPRLSKRALADRLLGLAERCADRQPNPATGPAGAVAAAGGDSYTSPRKNRNQAGRSGVSARWPRGTR